MGETWLSGEVENSLDRYKTESSPPRPALESLVVLVPVKIRTVVMTSLTGLHVVVIFFRE